MLSRRKYWSTCVYISCGAPNILQCRSSRYDHDVNQRVWPATGPLEDPWRATSDAGIPYIKLAVAAIADLVPARDGGGSRLRSLFKTGKSVKMHTWCLLASPFGAYIFSHGTGIQPLQLQTMQQLLCSVSFLQDKAIPREDCPLILNGIARALTLVELHLPCCEMDMKLHQLLHLAERLRHLGPSFTTAMWGYEELWHHLVLLMKKKDTPETTCMFSWMQMESALLAGEGLSDECIFHVPMDEASSGRTLTSQQQQYWTVLNTSEPDVQMDVMPSLKGFKREHRSPLPGKLFYELHLMYMQHSETYESHFHVFMVWLWDQWLADRQPAAYILVILEELGISKANQWRRKLLFKDGNSFGFKHQVRT